MQVIPETKNFFSIFFLNFEIYTKFSTFLKKKMTLLANVFWKLRTSKNVVRLISKKRCFTVPFNKQHGQRAQTLFKSEWWRL